MTATACLGQADEAERNAVRSGLEEEEEEEEVGNPKAREDQGKVAKARCVGVWKAKKKR